MYSRRLEIRVLEKPGLAEKAGHAKSLEDMKKAGFWASLIDHLLMFPLSQPIRVMLLEMLCVGTKPYQVFTASRFAYLDLSRSESKEFGARCTALSL